MTTDRAVSPDRMVPEDPLAFIVRCVRGQRIYWTYHVNMRLAGRHISRRDICEPTDTYELIEAYPDDKYLPSYLVLAAAAGSTFHEDKDIAIMKCRVFGAQLRNITTDLPLKVSGHTIVVVKKLPVMQCDGCIEYLIEDRVMAKLDELLFRVDRSMELEVVPFAA